LNDLLIEWVEPTRLALIGQDRLIAKGPRLLSPLIDQVLIQHRDDHGKPTPRSYRRAQERTGSKKPRTKLWLEVSINAGSTRERRDGIDALHCTAILGLAAALAFGPLALGLSLIIWLLDFLYNWRLKAAGLWGNLIVATSVGITFVLGGMAVGHPWSPTVWTFALAVVVNLAGG